MKPLFLAFLWSLGSVTAQPNSQVEVPVVVEAEQCVIDINSTVETDLTLDYVLEGPNVLPRIVTIPGGYRIGFEVGTCAEGEIAKLVFITPGALGAHVLKTTAEYRLQDGSLVVPRAVNGKVLVKP